MKYDKCLHFTKNGQPKILTFVYFLGSHHTFWFRIGRNWAGQHYQRQVHAIKKVWTFRFRSDCATDAKRIIHKTFTDGFLTVIQTGVNCILYQVLHWCSRLCWVVKNVHGVCIAIVSLLKGDTTRALRRRNCVVLHMYKSERRYITRCVETPRSDAATVNELGDEAVRAAAVRQ